MMTRIFWETILLISGSLFTFGAGYSSSVTIEANISISLNSTTPPNAPSRSSATTSSRSTTTTISTTTNIPTVKSSLFNVGPRQTNATITDATISINATSSAAANTSASSSSTNSSSTTKSLTETTTSNIHPVKIRLLSNLKMVMTTGQQILKCHHQPYHIQKFVAAAVRSHFDDCPDSHRHFCFHGTCRFLILEETPACVCHPGFVGMRCEHADLLAVVATNHRQQTIATVLVLCVIGCVLIMVLCTVLHCWWRQDCRRRSHAHHYVTEKHGVSCYPSESVV